MYHSCNATKNRNTGGVRCERAGSYLRALSESGSGAWRGKDPPRGIYQLRGGIQAYLEVYGSGGGERAEGGGSASATEGGGGYDDDDDGANAGLASECDGGGGGATTTRRTADAKPCLYRGKNFVFDPRRTDRVVGAGIANGDDGGAPAARRAVVSRVGRCVLCSIPHDDYDNGHAPCEEREARCCRCRVLLLVCDDCRRRARCWGEPPPSGDDDRRRDIFCGDAGAKCVDDGNVAENVEVARY